MQTIKANFVNKGVVFEAPKGTKLSEINEKAGFPQDLVCGSNGKCGKCATLIVENGKEKTVLSCQFEVHNDIDVIKILNMANKKVNVLTSKISFDVTFDPQLRALSVAVRDIMPDHTESFMGEIEKKYNIKKISCEALKKLAQYAKIHHPERILNLVIFKEEIIDIRIGTEQDIYGFAIDIGSTTVAGYLYNMGTMELIGTYSSLNRQTAIGADVISRIGYTIRNENGLDVLRQKIYDTINDLIAGAEADGFPPQNIYEMVLCGNSTMQHLFLGLHPENLGNAPFTSVTRDFVDQVACCTSLNMNPNGHIVFLPLIGGFVGADTMAVLIGIEEDSKPRIVIDLGTNGEIAVGMDENYVACSTACGPALEGAGLTCGMRAAAGAVQHFIINKDRSIALDVIENVPATGICGSGIIDILAELIRCKVINWRGKMLSKEEYEVAYGRDALSERLVMVTKKADNPHDVDVAEPAFVLAFSDESGNGQDVIFSQSDSRYVQLAKAAISAGTDLMVKEYGIAKEAYYEICLAGAFGNYLNVENAQYIGLLPEYGVPIRVIGNGAGTGVQVYMLDQSVIKRCEKIQKTTKHVELNHLSEFKRVYAKNGYFRKVEDESGSDRG